MRYNENTGYVQFSTHNIQQESEIKVFQATSAYRGTACYYNLPSEKMKHAVVGSSTQFSVMVFWL
jgi:hypothetical protein